jgi:hypothetical protein
MLTDSSISYVHKEGVRGVALVWVIDTQCLYDLALSQEHASIFTGYDEILDISEEHPEHDGITVRFLKNGELVEEFQTSEYFGSVLLSNPQILNLLEHPYGRYVESPNALFINGEFVILDTDMSQMEPFYSGQHRT